MQSELFEVTSKVSEKAEAKSDEVELLLNDLEACQQRASLAEKEVEALSEQIRVLQESGSRSVGQVFNGALYCKTNMARAWRLMKYCLLIFRNSLGFFFTFKDVARYILLPHYRPGNENAEALLMETAKLDDVNCQLSLKDREVSQLLVELQQAR